MQGRILVVEDDTSILHFILDLLTEDGYDAVGVRSPDQVQATADAHAPELVIIDIMLPQHSGIEVAEALRAYGYSTTPMIAMSASNSMRDLAAHTGLFHRTIRKPFDIYHLSQHIASLLSSRTVSGTAMPSISVSDTGAGVAGV